MQFEEQIVIFAPAQKVFAMYATVGSWSIWDPEVKAASIDGAFAAGATGTLEPAHGPKAKIVITQVETNRAFTAQRKLPLCTMRVEHELLENAGKTTVVHRVVFRGLLVGGPLRKSMPRTLRGLKRIAEMY